ncbi:MAG: SpoIIE family protein phosphatase [Christensenellales bacterium]|nr:SpoIIE family protein phosphatase [Christensenellales bacterium]
MTVSVMNELYIDTGTVSLIKAGEQLCGDCVVFDSNEDTSICVLADGLGSGVKANILATLTSTILATMSAGGMSVEECVNTIVRTLPECNVRKIAYATFTIVKIRNQRYVELTRFDNPHTIVLQNGKNYDFKFTTRVIEGKRIYESRFEAREGDVLVVTSDGAILAGLGDTYAFGWERENIVRYLEDNYSPNRTAKQIARMLASECNRLYRGKPGDDTSVAVMRLCKRQRVDVMIGPPSSSALDEVVCRDFFAGGGIKIVCGGTTNRIAAGYLGRELKASLEYYGSDLPPMYTLEGVDLSTEAVVTISRVLEYAGEYLSGTSLTATWEEGLDGASRIARVLFDQGTDIHFFVGCAMNPAHQNPKLSLAFGAKFQLIERLSTSLEAMGKKVTVKFY